MRTYTQVLVIGLLIVLPVNLRGQPHEGEKGDVNNDGTVNLTDVLKVVNYMLNIDDFNDQEFWRADCNSPVGRCSGDSSVNIFDVIKIVNLVLEVDLCPIGDTDGNIYRVIKIGNQWWMAENLKVTHYRSGDAIPNVTDNTEWANLTTGAYCNYNNDAGNVATYGRLYNWYAVDDSRNIAPSGWHVPTDAEWKQLEMSLGMSQSEADDTGWRGTNEGSKLAGNASLWASGDLENNPEFGTSGFTALPGGCRLFSGYSYYLGIHALFWSAPEHSSGYAWYRSLSCYYAQVYRGSYGKVHGLSVRCVRD